MSPSFICRLLLVATAPLSPGSAAAAELLWYDQPARAWMTQALPVGNGRVGVMLFGGIDQEPARFAAHRR